MKTLFKSDLWDYVDQDEEARLKENKRKESKEGYSFNRLFMGAFFQELQQQTGQGTIHSKRVSR